MPYVTPTEFTEKMRQRYAQSAVPAQPLLQVVLRDLYTALDVLEEQATEIQTLEHTVRSRTESRERWVLWHGEVADKCSELRRRLREVKIDRDVAVEAKGAWMEQWIETDTELIETRALLERAVEAGEQLAGRPQLGLVTTEQLLDELRARIEADYFAGGGLQYTPVDGRPEGSLLDPHVHEPDMYVNHGPATAPVPNLEEGNDGVFHPQTMSVKS